MTDAPLDSQRNALIETITEVYARGDMDMPAFERAVTKVNACADRQALEAEASLLGLALPVPVDSGSPGINEAVAGRDAIELICVSGTIRQTGDWIKARAYRISLQSSKARLDLSEYEGARGLRLLLYVEAVSSDLKLIVPSGFEVEDRFSERRSSTVRNRPKDGTYGDNLVVLAGSLHSSTVRVKYR